MSHYFRIEKSGCCAHKGLCQIRYDFYKKSGDKYQSSHFVYFPYTCTDTDILQTGKTFKDKKKNNHPMKNNYGGSINPTWQPAQQANAQARIDTVLATNFATEENMELYGVFP